MIGFIGAGLFSGWLFYFYFSILHKNPKIFMRLFFLIFISILFFNNITAQPLAAYTDNQNQVMVWDRGMVRKIDYMQPTLMKTGRTAIPYLDNSRTFKIYYGGGVRTGSNDIVNSFFVTDNLVAYLCQKSLNIFDRGVTKNLTGVCDQYFIGDSLVLFLDSYKGSYRAYYNGQFYNIETYFSDSVLSNIKVSDNIIAYDNFANQFKIFYHGSVFMQEDYQVISFDAGRNTVAYVDNDRKFKIFHNGKTILADEMTPISYKVGDDLVAFISSDRYFKIFYDDSIRTIGTFHPSYQVADNIVAFKDAVGMFKIFYKGETTEMENYMPANLTIQYNSVAYINSANTLRLFSEGEAYDVTNADIASWQLNYDVISYQIGQGIFKVFYKGTEY